MIAVVGSVTALLLAVSILLTGHGLQLTVAPLYAMELGWSSDTIGWTGSAYFLGFVLGCLTIPRLVSGVGHIRVFSTLVCVATCALLLLGLFPVFGAWLIARLATGWAFAGLYMVIESWLNERTTPENRGTVLSLYATLTLVAITLGQFATSLPLTSLQFILLGAAILVLGAVPVGLTRTPAPAEIPAVGFEFRAVFRASQVAIAAAFAGGLVTSGFWTLGPVVASQSLGAGQAGYFMAITLLGGAVIQLPVGRLSDHIDRRWVLLGLALAGITVCAATTLLGPGDSVMYFALMFLFGGCMFPMYAISLAHANDHTRLPLIETGSVILLVHSAGSIAGPVVMSSLLSVTAYGMQIFGAGVFLVFAGWAAVRIFRHPVDRPYFEPFQEVPKTSHEFMEIVSDLPADGEAFPSTGATADLNSGSA